MRRLIAKTYGLGGDTRGKVIPPIVLPDGRTLPVELRPSERARRLALRLSPASGSVVLVVPRRTALAAALDFLDSRRSWVVERADCLKPRVAFVDGVEIPVLGLPHRLTAVGAGGRRRGFWIGDG